MPDMRPVEMYVGELDDTWHKEMVEIPTDTPDDEIENAAVYEMTAKLTREDRFVAFHGVYHIPPLDDEIE